MKATPFLLAVTVAALFTSCGPSSSEGNSHSTTDSTQNTTENTSGQAVNSTTVYEFSLEVLEGETDPETGVPSVSISVGNSNWGSPRFITEETSYSAIKPDDFASKKIPSGAVLAFSSWYAGGGYDYYGAVEEGMLNIYRRVEDEGIAPQSAPFLPYVQIGMDPESPVTEHFICYKADKGNGRLSIGFDKEGYAISAKVDGEKGWRRLVFSDDQTENGSATLVTLYEHRQGSQQVGMFTLTHSGNWDYAEYKPNTGAAVKYTIDHEASLVGDAFSKMPCF